MSDVLGSARVTETSPKPDQGAVWVLGLVPSFGYVIGHVLLGDVLPVARPAVVGGAGWAVTVGDGDLVGEGTAAIHTHAIEVAELGCLFCGERADPGRGGVEVGGERTQATVELPEALGEWVELLDVKETGTVDCPLNFEDLARVVVEHPETFRDFDAGCAGLSWGGVRVRVRGVVGVVGVELGALLVGEVGTDGYEPVELVADVARVEVVDVVGELEVSGEIVVILDLLRRGVPGLRS